jgi:hypothetical protein
VAQPEVSQKKDGVKVECVHWELEDTRRQYRGSTRHLCGEFLLHRRHVGGPLTKKDWKPQGAEP